MIIKKKKNIKNKEDSQEIFEQPKVEEKILNEITFPEIPVISDREERRRGDRRRGYRRIDDRNLVSRAHEEANAIKEMAAKEGFKYGVDQSRAEIENLRVAIDDFINAKQIAIDKNTQDIAFIALKVAEKIIKTEVACDETIVLNIINEVLKEIKRDEISITIMTNPADVQYVKENLLNIFPYDQKEVKINITSDEDVEWGSCVVKTTNGIIDANFSTQLKILKEAFEIKM